MAFTNVTPILRILDEHQAKAFYVDYLGFQVDWEHRAEGPLYMQVSLGDVLLHLSQHSGDATVGAAIKLHTNEVQEFVDVLRGKETPPGMAEQPLGVARQPWGSLDMLLVDPFGNRLIFTDAAYAKS